MLAVRDDGPGIPEAHLPHVFSRFYRADAARGGGGGSGLGLAIVARIASLHGGAARAENPGGGGAQIVVTLPLAPAEVAAAADPGRP